MKKIIGIFLLLTIFGFAKAQIQTDPAHWAYGIKKLTGNTYELHLQCTIDAPWHIYAQKQGPAFIGTATKIDFTSQAGLILTGKPLELGKKEKYVNNEVQITNFEFATKVDFVQKATVKHGIKTITGKIDYQTCTRERCLTATSVNFSIPIK